MTTFRYRAFISYSHADERWARWLHRSLETYRVPARLVGQLTAMGPVPAKLAPVFRDRDELASATDLGSKLTEALQASACQVVICSRSAARSHWVNEEILAYKRLGRADRVFCLIVDGEPYSSAIPGEKDNECFPPALRFKVGHDGALTTQPEEPIAADARPGKDGKANAKVKLIAGMLGVGFDDLKQRELQRRNRKLAVVSASAVAGMVTAIGLATVAFIARNDAQEQRVRAEKEAETARRTASFMIDLFQVSDPSEARGQSITAREILQQGAGKIANELSDQPEVQASLMDTIGKVYTSLGLYTDASYMLTQTVELRRNLPGVSKLESAQSTFNLGNVLTEKAEYDQAEIMYLDALRTLQNVGPAAALLEIDITAALGELRFRTGQYEAATPLLRKVLEQREQRLGKDDPRVAQATEKLGMNLFDQGRYDEAELMLRQSLVLRERILGAEPHPALAENIANLALTRRLLGDLGEAEALYNRALAMKLRLYGDIHPDIASTKTDLADIYTMQGVFDQAESLYDEVLGMYRSLLGEEHPQIAIVMNNLAFLRYDSGDIEGAIATSQAALTMQRKVLSERHPDIAASLAAQGRWLTELSRYQEAEAALREALEIQTENLEPDHPRLATTRIDLAELFLHTERSEAALEQATQGVDSLRVTLSASHWRFAAAQQTQGAALLALGRLHAARDLLTDSYTQLSDSAGVSPTMLRRGLQRLVLLHQARGEDAMAQTYEAIMRREHGSS